MFTQRYSSRIALAVATACASLPAMAQDELEETIVTATRTPVALDAVDAPVIVITRQDIERSLASDVSEILQGHAGLEIARNGGPGQTTTLFMRGTDSNHTVVLIDGVRVNELSASERNIAMVFQFVSLYPHLSIKENIVFPLKARGVAKAEIARKLDWVTDVFKLGDELARYPSALPPGARQKVALARAVIRDPAVLLLDEPLSAIDEQFREEMRWELGHLQRQLGVTTIYVTHDQREAMSDPIGDVAGGEAELEPGGAGLRVAPASRVVGGGRVVAEQELGAPGNCALDLPRAPRPRQGRKGARA